MRVRIPSDIMTYVQFLYYQYTGVELLLKNFARKDCKCETDKYTYDQDVIDYYLKQLREIHAEFENAKIEVITQFKPEWLGKPVVFDFVDGFLKLEGEVGHE